MVVEDDGSLREIYSIRIAAEGYTVVTAGDGEEALAVAVREKPDLILSDVMMPKISGSDMLDILRATPETAGIKVIMMTALSGDDQRDRGQRLGADRYLVKSQVGIEDVVNVIHEVLGDKKVPALNPNGTLANAPAPEPGETVTIADASTEIAGNDVQATATTDMNATDSAVADATAALDASMPANTDVAAPSMEIVAPTAPAAESDDDDAAVVAATAEIAGMQPTPAPEAAPAPGATPAPEAAPVEVPAASAETPATAEAAPVETSAAPAPTPAPEVVPTAEPVPTVEAAPTPAPDPTPAPASVTEATPAPAPAPAEAPTATPEVAAPVETPAAPAA